MNNNRKVPDLRPAPREPVTVKICGNVLEIRYMKNRFSGGTIQKLDADHYIDLRTGELGDFIHSENRADSKATVSQSLRNLRDVINTNLTAPERALWVTFTYRENMNDPERLYQDFRRFWLRFRYQYPAAEYIAAAEPQARGAWHLHCLFFFPDKVPFIPNEKMAALWRQGFTKTKSLKGFQNPGLYLTAYLGDMELTEAVQAGVMKGQGIAEKETADERGNRKKKAVTKGARLFLYPPGFRLFRCSRGIKRPEILRTTEEQAQEIVGSAPLTFEKTIEVRNDSGEVLNTINYRQYTRQKGENENFKYESF